MRPPFGLLCLVLICTAVAGCVGPTGAGDTCQAPPPQGEIAFLIGNQDGTTRDVPASTSTLWSLAVTCSAEARDVTELRFELQTPTHGTLVAAPTQALPNDGRLTFYASVRDTKGDDGTNTNFGPELPPPGTGPAFRMRIIDDRHSFEGLDVNDQIQFSYDGEGRRDFQSELPPGSYRLTIRDEIGGRVAGHATIQLFAKDFETQGGSVVSS